MLGLQTGFLMVGQVSESEAISRMGKKRSASLRHKGERAFLFLYPLTQHIDDLLDWHKRAFERQRCHASRINQIIAKRYRNQGYRVVWAYFAGDQPNIPDIADHHLLIRTAPQDVRVSVGITFERHVSEHVYPDPAYVIAQLPSPISHLVLGGFHQQDCVDRIAAYAHGQGINVSVDEDATDFFFVSTALHGKIPIRRDIRLLPEYRIAFARRMASGGSTILNDIIRDRQKRPWLAQVRRSSILKETCVA